MTASLPTSSRRRFIMAGDITRKETQGSLFEQMWWTISVIALVIGRKLTVLYVHFESFNCIYAEPSQCGKLSDKFWDRLRRQTKQVMHNEHLPVTINTSANTYSRY